MLEKSELAHDVRELEGITEFRNTRKIAWL